MLNENPFSIRAHEYAEPGPTFVKFFSPEALELIDTESLGGKVTYLLSAPGGGKTSLLKLFTPEALHAASIKPADDGTRKTYTMLHDLGVLSEGRPNFIGVYLTCASGYMDIPPSFAGLLADGTFRALLNCRIVGRSIRAAAALAGLSSPEGLSVHLSGADGRLTHIPSSTEAVDLLNWAQRTERKIYATLDALGPAPSIDRDCCHHTLEAVQWLSDAEFFTDGGTVAPKKILMLDDIQRLAHGQRRLLHDETLTMRAQIPIWMAERTIALKPEMMLSQGVRTGREVIELWLDQRWASARGKRSFERFAASVAEKRAQDDDLVLMRTFQGRLAERLEHREAGKYERPINELFDEVLAANQRTGGRYSSWIATWKENHYESTYHRLISLQELRILVARDEGNQQLTLDLEPLSKDEFDSRYRVDLRAAASIQLSRRFRIPYYYGFSEIAALSSYNIEEFLGVASRFFERLAARRTVGKPRKLDAGEQHKIILELSETKMRNLTRGHTHGELAKNLLSAMGEHFRDLTHAPRASYLPGVTGIGLDRQAINTLKKRSSPDSSSEYGLLARVLQECIAENLLMINSDVKQGEAGKEWTVLYINRLLGAQFHLPCGRGGWNKVSLDALIRWMHTGTSK